MVGENKRADRGPSIRGLGVEAMSSDLDLLSRHRRVWKAKPNLRASYRRYYDMLLARCPRSATVLELGCGLGAFAERARALGYEKWIATDIIATESARLRCDATALPFSTRAVDRIVFVDVLHHLASPARFFAEAARVLRPGGAIVGVEPWVTAFSYPIYRFIHDEGCDLSRDVDAPFSAAGSKAAYEGDCGLTTLVCRQLSAANRWHGLGFAPPRVKTFNDFAYLATRGMREGRDVPTPIYAAARAVLDDFLAPLAPFLGVRALLTWQRI
jgi:SAM-dependent methyltransferase